MTAIKTQIGAQDTAHKNTHSPTASVPQSDVWSAIQYLSALIASLTTTVTAVSNTADLAREDAKRAMGVAKRARLASTDAQIAFTAQIFN